MKRKGMFLCVLIMSLFLTACGFSKSDESSATAGVYKNGMDEYYAITLANGKKVSDYFELTGAENKITYGMTTLDSQSRNLGVLYYRTVFNGGTVVYRRSETGTFLYLPKSFPEDEIKIVSAKLALGNVDKTMSIYDAQKYIPGLLP